MGLAARTNMACNTSNARVALALLPSILNFSWLCAILTCKPVSMVRKCSSSAPHKLPRRVLLLGLNWWRTIKLLARRDVGHAWPDAVVLQA